MARARLVPQHRLGARGSMPFDFLSQQLVFSGLVEFCRWAVPVWRRWRDQVSSTTSRFEAWTLRAENAHFEESDSQSAVWEHVCSVCEASPPIIPFEACCGHVGCYVCLQAAAIQDSQAKCPRCAKLILPIARKK